MGCAYEDTREASSRAVHPEWNGCLPKDDCPAPREMSYFTTPDGTRIRYACWSPENPQAGAGTVVFLQGRTEFIEKNIYTYRDLLARNFEVWTFDWRGQGLSDRSQSVTDCGHIDSYGTYLADLEYFLGQVVRLTNRPRPRILLAHSMGGMVGLLHVHNDSTLFDKAVFTSPLVRLPPGTDNAAVRIGNLIKTRLGFQTSCALTRRSVWRSAFRSDPCGLNDLDAAEKSLRNRRESSAYSHDYLKLAQIDCWIARSRCSGRQGLAVAGPTSGWIRATFQSSDRLAAMPNIPRIPMLVVGAERDAVVSYQARNEFCSRVACKCAEIQGAGDEILIELTPYRAEFWAHFENFVDPKQKWIDW